MEKIRIVVADDHHILLDGLKALLQKQKDIEIAGLFDNGKALYDAVTVLRPQVALLDISMPGMDGLTLTRLLRQDHPSIAILILSMYDDAGHIMEMIEAGASGYLLKNVTDKELLEGIKTVAAGKLYFSPEVSETIAGLAIRQQRRTETPPEPKLTDRELEILKLISQEHSNAEIAGMLFISERTVETHRKNMLRKTSNKTILGLLKYALEKQLI